MKTLLNIVLIFIPALLLAQVPNSFKYQAVARDDMGNVLENKNIAVKCTLLTNYTSNPTPTYSEEHTVVTSDQGIFTLEIGSGARISNSRFDDFDWVREKEVGIRIDLDVTGTGNNYTNMGTLPLLTVPYAMHANTVENADDADADPQNEIQMLSVSGNQLTIAGGNTVNLPTGGGGSGDDDPNNEIQNLSSSKSGNNVNLGISMGGTGTIIDISDSDNDANNEIQDLDYNRTGSNVNLSLTGANGIIFSVEDEDADPQNEIQTLDFNAADQTLTITNGNQVKLDGITGPWSPRTNGIGYENAVTIGDADPMVNGLQASTESGAVILAHASTKNGGGTMRVSSSEMDRSIAMNAVGDLSFTGYNDGTVRAKTGEIALGTGLDRMVLNSQNAPMHLMQDGNTKIILKTDGKVGYGTTNPIAAHHFYGDLFMDASQGRMRVGYPNSHQWGMTTTNGGKDLIIGSSADGNAFDNELSMNQEGDMAIHGNLRINGNDEGLILNGENTNWRWRTNTPGDLIFLTHEDVTEESVFRSNAIGQLGVRGGLIRSNYAMSIKCHESFGVLMINENTGDEWETVALNNGSYGFYKNGSKAAEIDGDGIYTASDLSFKTNIQTVPQLLQKVMLLEPKMYEYLTSPEKTSIGFIAQDVQEVFPELVKVGAQDKDGGKLAVNYAGFGVVAIKSIQEQQKQLENQEQSIEELKSEVEQLKRLIREISK